MPPSTVKLGRQSGEHGSYTFYRSFSYQMDKKWRHIKLGKFFFVRLNKNSPICIGELQLVWTGRYSSHPLTSVRLYFLPEQIPDGRQSHHGQDELVATDKMVVHAKDLIKWIICDGVEWKLGLSLMKPNEAAQNSLKNLEKNISCHKCKTINTDGVTCDVQVIDLKSYCKLRTVVKRAANELSFLQILNCPKLSAIYDLKHIQPNKYIMFCKETFLCAELENHDFRCDHLAPNLKGRPRKKTRGKQVDSKLKSCTESSPEQGVAGLVSANKSGNSSSAESEKQKEAERYEKVMRMILTNKEHFTKTLYKHMKDVGTPISKVPSLGFKKVDLHSLFRHVYCAGGYKEICRKRLWKTIYDKLGGNPHYTSAPSCTKKQYERLLLSFERNIVLPGTAGKIKVHLPSQNFVRRKPRLKTRLDKIKQEWSSLVNQEKIQQLTSSDKLSVATTHLKWQLPSKLSPAKILQQKEYHKNDDEDQIPLSILSALKKEENEKLIGLNNSVSLSPSKTSYVTATSTWTIPTSFSLSDVSHSHDGCEIKSFNVSGGDISRSHQESKKMSDENNQLSHKTKFNLIPAHAVQKASMPLNILGPCHPDELTMAQRSPWTTKLSNSYGNPNINCRSTTIKNDVSDEALDLSYGKRIKHDYPSEPKLELAVDEWGAIDMTINNSKPLDLIKNKQKIETVTEQWKPQNEPIDFSKSKSLSKPPMLQNQPKDDEFGNTSAQTFESQTVPLYRSPTSVSKSTFMVNSSPLKPFYHSSLDTQLNVSPMQNSAIKDKGFVGREVSQKPLVDKALLPQSNQLISAKNTPKDNDALMDLSRHVDPSWRTGSLDSLSNTGSKHVKSLHSYNEKTALVKYENPPSYTHHSDVTAPPPPPKYTDFHYRLSSSPKLSTSKIRHSEDADSFLKSNKPDFKRESLYSVAPQKFSEVSLNRRLASPRRPSISIANVPYFLPPTTSLKPPALPVIQSLSNSLSQFKNQPPLNVEKHHSHDWVQQRTLQMMSSEHSSKFHSPTHQQTNKAPYYFNQLQQYTDIQKHYTQKNNLADLQINDSIPHSPELGKDPRGDPYCRPLSLAIPKAKRTSSSQADFQTVRGPEQGSSRVTFNSAMDLTPSPLTKQAYTHPRDHEVGSSKHNRGMALTSNKHGPHMYIAGSSSVQQSQFVPSSTQLLMVPNAHLSQQFLHQPMNKNIKQPTPYQRSPSTHALKQNFPPNSRPVNHASFDLYSSQHKKKSLVTGPLHSSFHQTHQLNSPPLRPKVHAQPSLQRLPPNSNISAYHRLLSPNYTSLPALPRLQPIPSRHSSAPATSIQGKYSVNPNIQ